MVKNGATLLTCLWALISVVARELSITLTLIPIAHDSGSCDHMRCLYAKTNQKSFLYIRGFNDWRAMASKTWEGKEILMLFNLPWSFFFSQMYCWTVHLQSTNSSYVNVVQLYYCCQPWGIVPLMFSAGGTAKTCHCRAGANVLNQLSVEATQLNSYVSLCLNNKSCPHSPVFSAGLYQDETHDIWKIWGQLWASLGKVKSACGI